MSGEYTGTGIAEADYRARGATPAPAAPEAQSFWQKYVLPLRPAAEQGMAFMSGAPIADEKGKIQPTGIEKFAAGQVIPDTATDALLNAAMLALPEGKALEALPPPVRALLKSRLGRIGAMTGIGAGAGAVTGEGAGTGAAKGGFGQAGGEVQSGVARRVLEGNEATRYLSGIGKTIREQYPIVDSALDRMGQSLKTAKDFLAFKGGQDSPVMKGASAILGEAKDQVKVAVGNNPILTTSVVMTPKGAILRPSQAWTNLLRDNLREAQELKIGQSATFDQADQLISRARQKAYRLSTGTGKDSALAARIRRNSDAALDALAARLNSYSPGMGDMYRSAQGDWAEANDVAKMFSEKGVFEGGKVSPEKLQSLAMESGGAGYYTELGRTPRGQVLRNQIFRGGPATGTDEPRMGVSLYGELWPLPVHLRTHINPFGTSRVGQEQVKLYHGIPAVVAKALGEYQFGEDPNASE